MTDQKTPESTVKGYSMELDSEEIQGDNLVWTLHNALPSGYLLHTLIHHAEESVLRDATETPLNSRPHTYQKMEKQSSFCLLPSQTKH